MSTTAFRFICLLLTLTSAEIAQAQFGFLYEWINPNGGSYNSNGNWLPVGVPDTNLDGAIFDLDSTYNVQLPANDVTVDQEGVTQGDVDFVFATPPFLTPPYAYTTNAISVSSAPGSSTEFTLSGGRITDSGSLTLGTGGQANLILVRSDLTTGTATLGMNSGSAGTLTIDDRSSWSGTGTQVIGAEGSGELDILAYYRSGGLGGCCYPTQGAVTSSAAVLGQAVGGSGLATIHGIWNSGDLTVGDAGTGKVDILANPYTPPSGNSPVSSVGMLQSTNANIATQPGSSGTVSVTGFVLNATNGFAASEWDIADSLAVGGTSASAGGMGQLTLGPENIVTVGSDMRIWEDGTLSTSEYSDLSVTGTANLAGTLEFTPPYLGFDPQLNDEFPILSAAGGVVGTFDSTMFPPLDSGLAWSVEYDATDVMLKVISAPVFTADFDHDGDVDGNDFLVWQRNPTVGNLSDWQTQYGNAPPLASSRAVPEPASILMLAMGLLSMYRNHEFQRN